MCLCVCVCVCVCVFNGKLRLKPFSFLPVSPILLTVSLSPPRRGVVSEQSADILTHWYTTQLQIIVPAALQSQVTGSQLSTLVTSWAEPNSTHLTARLWWRHFTSSFRNDYGPAQCNSVGATIIFWQLIVWATYICRSWSACVQLGWAGFNRARNPCVIYDVGAPPIGQEQSISCAIQLNMNT